MRGLSKAHGKEPVAMRKLASGLLVAMAAVAIWRSGGGNIDMMVASLWNFIDTGAQWMTEAWNAVVRSVSSGLSTGSGTP